MIDKSEHSSLAFAKIVDEHKTRLPAVMFGMTKRGVVPSEKEAYIAHVYNDAKDGSTDCNVSLYFFFYTEDKTWQCGVSWSDGTSHYSDYHVMWTAAYKEIRSYIKDRSELLNVISNVPAGELTPDQIVAILLAE